MVSAADKSADADMADKFKRIGRLSYYLPCASITFTENRFLFFGGHFEEQSK
jgi:hypothetical protein